MSSAVEGSYGFRVSGLIGVQGLQVVGPGFKALVRRSRFLVGVTL